MKLVDTGRGKLDHPIAHPIVRLARDVGLDHVFAPHSDGLQKPPLRQDPTGILQGQSEGHSVRQKQLFSHIKREFCADANLPAHCANSGCIKEDAIRDDILQSLISHPKLYNHGPHYQWLTTWRRGGV